MNIQKALLTLGMVAVFTGLVVAARMTEAAAPRPTAVEYQMFGIATFVSGQGARVNVTNVQEASGLNFTVQFLDAEGEVLKREEHYLKPGQSSFSELVPAVNVLSRRVATRVVVESVPDAPELTGRQTIANLEVFQVKTQATSAVYEPQVTLYR